MTVPDDVFSCCCDWGFEIIAQLCSIPLVTTCSQFPSAPGWSSSWELTVAGFTDNNCTGCDAINGSFRLNVPITNSCSRRSGHFNLPTFGSSCGVDSQGAWLLFRGDGSPWGGSGLNWYLFCTGFAGASVQFAYELDGAIDTFDPEGPNTFNFISSVEFACQTPPATLTIEPSCL